MRPKPLPAGTAPLHPSASGVPGSRPRVYLVQRTAAWALTVGIAIVPVLLLLLRDPTGGVDVLGETIARPPAATSPSVTPDPGEAALIAGSVPIAPANTGVDDTTDGASAALALLVYGAPQPTTVVEVNDNGYYVVVDELGNEAGAGSAIGPVTGTDDFGVIVHARAAGGIITVSVTLENQSTSAVAFPGGLAVSVPITRDGTAWRHGPAHRFRRDRAGSCGVPRAFRPDRGRGTRTVRLRCIGRDAAKHWTLLGFTCKVPSWSGNLLGSQPQFPLPGGRFRGFRRRIGADATDSQSCYAPSPRGYRLAEWEEEQDAAAQSAAAAPVLAPK